MHKRLSPVYVALILATVASATSGYAAGGSYTAGMQAASQARQVPLPLVEAIAYVNARWEVTTQPAMDGGYGPMNILPAQMSQATALSGHTIDQVKTDTAANLDAGAALLAKAHGAAGGDLASWRPAVVSLLGESVATQVYDALTSGETRTTATGETISLPKSLASLPRTGAAPGAAGVGAAATVASTDYPPAAWVAASPANYSTATRPSDYPVDMIVIHDIEGTYGSAIQQFQSPSAQSSAHYVVSDAGQITQMVAEHDIAWHAGNWDYNTRAIGIEHEGFATGPNWYTQAMYDASARLAGSICSRWGVPMDRAHVIGHYQVPDPNNPGQFGGAGHHTDPGTNWDWSKYMNLASIYANVLPSPPHMVLDAPALEGDKTINVSWQPARSCHSPITSYTVVGQPGNLTQTLPGTATSATFTGLTNGTVYTFTITAHNNDGQDSLTSAPATAGKPWATRESLWSATGSGPAVTSWGPNRLDTFYRGTDGGLYHQYTNGAGWSAAEALGGFLTSAPAAVSWGSNRIDIFARGGDYQLWHIAWSVSNWSAWQPLGGILSTAPTVSSWSPGRLDVFAAGTDNQLWHLAWAGAGWVGWAPLGGGLTAAPSAVSRAAGRIDVFIRGGDNALWTKSWTGADWSGWWRLGGSLASAPAASTWASNRLDVLAVTDAGGMQHLSGDGAVFTGWQNLGGGQWLPDPAVIARQAGTIDLLGDGPDTQLWHVTYQPA